MKVKRKIYLLNQMPGVIRILNSRIRHLIQYALVILLLGGCGNSKEKKVFVSMSYSAEKLINYVISNSRGQFPARKHIYNYEKFRDIDYYIKIESNVVPIFRSPGLEERVSVDYLAGEKEVFEYLDHQFITTIPFPFGNDYTELWYKIRTIEGDVGWLLASNTTTMFGNHSETTYAARYEVVVPENIFKEYIPYVIIISCLAFIIYFLYQFAIQTATPAANPAFTSTANSSNPYSKNMGAGNFTGSNGLSLDEMRYRQAEVTKIKNYFAKVQENVAQCKNCYKSAAINELKKVEDVLYTSGFDKIVNEESRKIFDDCILQITAKLQCIQVLALTPNVQEKDPTKIDNIKEAYEALEIDPPASIDEIKKQYRKKAMEYHPDRNSDEPLAKQKTQRINNAYAFLKDTLVFS